MKSLGMVRLTNIQTSIERSYEVYARWIDQSHMVTGVEFTLIHENRSDPLCALVELGTRQTRLCLSLWQR